MARPRTYHSERQSDEPPADEADAPESTAQLPDDHPHMQALEAGYLGELPEEQETPVDGERTNFNAVEQDDG